MNLGSGTQKDSYGPGDHSDASLPYQARHTYGNTSFKTKETNSTEEILVSMQRKLDEVESANSDFLVFGPSHIKALETLRSAQIQLAQAWMRSEGDELLDGEHIDLAKRPPTSGGDIPSGGVASGDDGHYGLEHRQTTGTLGEGTAGMEAIGGASTTGSIGGRSSASHMSDVDLLLARKRREMNEAHFNKVSASVTDVIEKLECVARAMVNVEQESRGIWGPEGDSTSV